MNITYNEKDNSIEIKDGFKTQYWITNVGIIFAIINVILFPVFVLDEKQMEWSGFIWIFLGIVMLIALTYQILNKSGAEKLRVAEISSLNETQFFGRKKNQPKTEKWQDKRFYTNEN